MGPRSFWLCLIGLGLTLTACATTPYQVLESFDACDRQAEACFDLCLLEETREDGQACDNACDGEANQCFASVSRRGLRDYPDWEPGSEFSFYGRTGEYSFRYGWIPGPHGQPYSYTRPEDRPYYDRRYYDPYFDNPNDCYGWRRAPWCWRYDWYRDRYRDRYYPDRRRPQPTRPADPVEPTDPVKPEPGTDPRPDRRNAPVWRPVPIPERTEGGGATPTRRNPDFEPLIPTERGEPVKPEPQPQRVTPRRDPDRATTRPVRRSEPVARPRPQPQPERARPQPQPQPERARPQPRPRPQPQRTQPQPRPEPPAQPQPQPRREPPPPRRTPPRSPDNDDPPSKR